MTTDDLIRDYAPIAYERHARDYARAAHGRGPWYDEVAVDWYGDTAVILPSDATPYSWREIWRRKRGHDVPAMV